MYTYLIVEMLRKRRPGGIPIRRATISQIPSIHRPRIRDNILTVTKGKYRLHAHDYMLQDMAMVHPDSRVRHTDPPRPPARGDQLTRLLAVPVENRSIALDGMRTLQPLFIRRSIVEPVATANIVKVSTVRMEGMRINTAVINSAAVLPYNLKHLTYFSRESAREIIEPVAPREGAVIRLVEVKLVVVDVDQVRRLGVGFDPVVAVLQPDRAVADVLMDVYDDSPGDFVQGWEIIVRMQRLQFIVQPALDRSGHGERRGRWDGGQVW